MRIAARDDANVETMLPAAAAAARRHDLSWDWRSRWTTQVAIRKLKQLAASEQADAWGGMKGVDAGPGRNTPIEFAKAASRVMLGASIAQLRAEGLLPAEGDFTALARYSSFPDLFAAHLIPRFRSLSRHPAEFIYLSPPFPFRVYSPLCHVSPPPSPLLLVSGGEEFNRVMVPSA